MGLRNISAWSIRNPVPSLVLFAALTIAGVIAFLQMPVNQNPEIAFPAVLVSVSQPGAAPTEIETQITQKVETAIRGLEGVDEIQSTMSEGSSQTFVQFSFSTPVDRAVTDVRDAISNIRSSLPDGVVEPRITRVIVNNAPVGNWSVEATDTTLEQLSWFVDTVVQKRLLAIPGMQSVRLDGGVDRAIRVILDPARMQALGVTAAQVNQTLRGINLNAAGGKTDVGGAEQSVRIVGSARDAFSLGQTQIPLGGSSQPGVAGTSRTVKLADIADVRDSSYEQLGLAKSGGKQVVGFAILRARGASEVDLYDATVSELAKIEKENPKYHFVQRFTSVTYTKRQYKSAIEAMIEGAVLAVVVVFLFLRDKRATIISALAIPLSAIPTFWIMSLIGFNLNFMTLLALSLVAGVLVDDAIVEIENIVRHMRMGKTAYQASIDAADEIGLAVVATTFSIVAVFLPVALMPGIAGQFFKNFGMTVVVAVLMSLLVARLLTPMVAAYFLKAGGIKEHGTGPWMDRYMALLRWTLTNRWKTVAIGGVAFAATVVLFATLPFTFQPQTNADSSTVSLSMTPGTTLAQTEAAVTAATRIIEQQPEVASTMQIVSAGSGSINIMLKRDRERNSIQFERETQPLLNVIPDARVNFSSQGFGGGGRDVSIQLAGDDPDKLNEAATKLAEAMKALPNLRRRRASSATCKRPEIVITPTDPGSCRQSRRQRPPTLSPARSASPHWATLIKTAPSSRSSDRQVPIRVALDRNSSAPAAVDNPEPARARRQRGTGRCRSSVVASITSASGAGADQAFRAGVAQQRQITIGAASAPRLDQWRRNAATASWQAAES